MLASRRQNVVERQLAKENVDRHVLGREKFIEKVWERKKEYGSRIINQLKRMGASCDWERERFTMDEGLSRAVREVFVTLYEEELIYRGERLITGARDATLRFRTLRLSMRTRKVNSIILHIP